MLSKLNTTCMEKLDLNDLNLQMVPSAMLALVVSNLKSVGLRSVLLTYRNPICLWTVRDLEIFALNKITMHIPIYMQLSGSI